MKRFINLFLSVTIILNTLSVFTAFAQNEEKATDTTYIDFLSILGVLETTDKSNITAEVTRESFAYLTAKATGISVTGNDESRRYKDVPTYSYAFSAINNLVDFGVISESADGRFRPNEYITYNEACTMLLNAMNYDVLAENYGVWPHNYQAVVSELDIEVKRFNDVVTLDKAAKLIVEFMKAPTYQFDGDEYSSSGKSLFEKVFSIECGEGTVEAFSGGALDSGDIMHEKHVKISGKNFEVGNDFDESKYFAGYVEYFYCYESGKEEIVFMRKADGAEKDLIIDIDNFASLENGRISYYKDENLSSVKRQSLENDYTIVYNGMPLITKVTETIENLNKGSITLKDSNDNGKYDVVLISDYKNFVVSTYDSYNSVVYDKIVQGNKIDFLDKSHVKVSADGKEISYDSLITDNVLSIAQSQDGEIISILVSGSFKKGKLEALNEDVAVIDGVEYEIEKSYTDKFLTGVGTEAVFHLDSFGKIAYASKAETSRMKFAYIIKGILSEDDDGYKIKMLTEDNEIVLMPVAEKITVDGDRLDTTEEIRDYFLDENKEFKQQLIEYAQNNAGEIREIDTSLVQNDYEDHDYSLREIFPDAIKDQTWWGIRGRYMYKALLRTQVVTFIVPEEADAADKDYRIAKSWQEATGSTSSEWWEPIDMYWRSEDSAYVDVAVKPMSGTIENSERNVVMVSQISLVWDDAEGEIVTGIKGIDSTGSPIMLQAPTELCDEGIEKGDLVTVGTYMNGEVSGAKLVYDVSKGGEPEGFVETSYPGVGEFLLLVAGGQPGKYSSDTQISFGYAKKVFDEGVVSMSRHLGGAETERMVFPAAVAIYDKTTGEIYSGSIADVMSYEAAGNDCSKLFYHTYRGVGDGMFIYK